MRHAGLCRQVRLCNYLAWDKTVQALDRVLSVASRPGFCADPMCCGHHLRLLSAEGQQIAPPHFTYGYDVVARVGWLRQERRNETLLKRCLWYTVPT